MSGRGELLTGVHLDKSQVLGEGAFGVVYRGRLGDAGVAIKTIKANSPEQAAELEATLLEEAAVWAAVQHPNVVQFYGVHKDAEGGLYLVSELMDGSVEGLLHEDGERVADGEEAVLTERQQLTMCLHVACALRRLHQLKILHSDLAARNVLYKRTGGGDLVFKVTDFGLATVGRGGDGASASASRSYQLVSREQVPVRWCAPEVLKRQLYSAEADVWSLGVYMWEVFSLGELPYGLHMTNADIAQQITPAKSTFRLEQPEECPEAAYQLMHSCWKFGRKLRITLPDMEDQLRQMRDKHAEEVGASSPFARSSAPAAAVLSPPAVEVRPVSPGPARRVASQSRIGMSGDESSGEEFYEKGLEAAKKGNGSVALEYYRQGAEYDHPDCQAALGQCYLDGKYIQKSEIRALELFRKAAVQGNGPAMVAMGDSYRLGVGDVVKSANTAFEWYQKAADTGYAMGYVMVVRCYIRAIGVPRSFNTAYEWAVKASQLTVGSEEGKAMLGICTSNGYGVKADNKKSAALLKEAADRGSLRGEAGYASLMYHGLGGVPKDEQAAAQTFKRLAEAGIESAMNNYGLMLAAGLVFPINKTLGLEWVQKAVDRQYPSAMALMGKWLATGTLVPKQENEGIRMLKAAAALSDFDSCLTLGNIAEERKEMKNALSWWRKGMDYNAECAYRIGADLVLNAPIDSDISKGMAILESSVEMGHPAGASIIGGLYASGVGVTKDIKRGAKWLQRGEEMGVESCTFDMGTYFTREGLTDREIIQLGLTSLAKGAKARNSSCCMRLGELYAKGRYVKEDKERARKYLMLPANEGDVDAQMLLAELNDELGDPRQAVKWYEKAARQKNPVAAFRLAEHVENGNGAAVNLHTAMAWYSRVQTAESYYRQGLILLQGGAGVPANLKGAAASFKKASAEGHVDGTYRFGLHCRDGIGMDVDKKEAVRLFRTAADEGSADASWALGHCYKEGYGGLKKDKKQAVYYFEAAAAAGHQEAKDLLRQGGAKKSSLKRLF